MKIISSRICLDSYDSQLHCFLHIQISFGIVKSFGSARAASIFLLLSLFGGDSLFVCTWHDICINKLIRYSRKQGIEPWTTASETDVLPLHHFLIFYLILSMRCVCISCVCHMFLWWIVWADITATISQTSRLYVGIVCVHWYMW